VTVPESLIPVLVIPGATAVGKTALSLTIAEQINGEIIGADSRQIYRFMDIGTAKPTPDQRSQIPHHLIDIVDPDQTMSLAQYQDAANAAVRDIFQRGSIPILVGGTGQYITALLEGWSAPRVPPNPELRAALEAFAAEQGHQALHDRLAQLDPQAAQTIDPHNIRRVIRALEVCLETGNRFSEQRQKRPPPYQYLVYGLTMLREHLYLRADQRLDTMMADGFLDEVRHLLEKGFSRNLPAMSGLGYSQLAAHLLDGTPLETALAETRRATRSFIRHQETWFRQHNHGAIWYNSETLQTADLVEATRRWLDERT